MNPVWTLRALRWSYAAFISAASGIAIARSLHETGNSGHEGSFVFALAITELLAAVAFFAERIEIAACAVLLAVFVTATILSLQAGDFLAVLRFVYFAMTAVYIVHQRRNMTLAA